MLFFFRRHFELFFLYSFVVAFNEKSNMVAEKEEHKFITFEFACMLKIVFRKKIQIHEQYKGYRFHSSSQF